MSVLVVGLSHKSAPVELLERAVLTPDAVAKLHVGLEPEHLDPRGHGPGYLIQQRFVLIPHVQADHIYALRHRASVD